MRSVPTTITRAAQRGSATVPAVVLIAVLAVVAVLVAAVGGAVADRRRVASAADLAALAAASSVQTGRDGCAAAARVARRNAADLTACTIDGADVTVRTERWTQPVLGLRLRVRSSARAGPERLVG